MLTMRRLIFALFLGFASLGLMAQPVLPPSAHGGSPNITIDLRDPFGGTIRKTPELSFEKMNPGSRNLAPKTRICHTEEAEREQAVFSAGATEHDTVFEQWMREEVHDKQRNRSLFRFGPEEVLTIPTVVHVIYSSTAENISEAQVLSQIQALNEDYRRQNADQAFTPRQFKQLSADTGIEFCLANVDPEGNPTTGIHRVSFAGAPFTERMMNERVKPATIWDPNRYFNIWVCLLANDVLGFATFPVSSGLTGVPAQRTRANTDGVVITHQAFGTTGTAVPPFNRGRTATHEVGHWLGLRHIWGDGPCGVDDFVGDTPEASAPHFGCQTGASSCRGSLAMVQNYMDYSEDACMNLFTRDQKARMRTVLRNSPRRGSLLESTACTPPMMPPTPAFASSVKQGCAPLAVRFDDLSEGNDISLQWSFPGGRPSRSNLASPQVVYRDPGVYPVSLRVTNPAGTRSVTQEGCITVTSSGEILPYLADFEPTGITAMANFYLENPDNDYTWGITERIGGGGQSARSLTINQFDNKLLNSADWFMLPILNFSGTAAPELSFDLSYAQFSDTFSDTLGVFVSTGCGTLFRAIYYKGGETLSTLNGRKVTQPFTPDGTEWRKEKIDLRSLSGQPNVQIAFISFNGNGNDMYLDNIRIGEPLPPAPEPQFTVSGREACANEVIRFSDQSLGQVTGHVWSFPGGTPASSNEANPKVRYAEPGTYDVILSVMGPGGERSLTRAGIVTVRPGPSLVVTGDREICEGESIEVTASGGRNYQWALSGTVRSEGSSARFSFTPEADDVLTVIATDGVCASRKVIPIRVMAVRPLTITPAAVEICPGEEVTLEATGAEAYQWSLATAEPQTQSGSLVVRPIQTTEYTVTGINAQGCQLSATVNVVVHESPESMTVSAERTQICPGESVRLFASGAASYRWSPTIGLNQSEGAQVVSSPDLTTTYRVEATNEFGCHVSKDITVEVTDYPEVMIRSLAPSICQGTDVILQARGGLIYEWHPSLLIEGRGTEVVAKPTEDQVFTVIGKTDAGCADTAQVFVEVIQPEPLELLASRYSICPGEDVLLSVRGGSRYQWQPAPGLGQTGGNRVSVRPRRDQVYTVSGTDQRGCRSSASVQINVSVNRTAYADFSSSQSITCAGQEIEFRSRSSDAVTYAWTFEGGTPAYSSEPNPIVTYPTRGSFSVRLEVQGCDRKVDRLDRTDYLYVTAPTAISLNSEDRIICRGEALTLSASGASRYEWSPLAGLDRGTGATVVARPLSTTTYTLTATDRQGCVAERKITLDVVSPQEIVLSPEAASICRGDSVLLTASGALDYIWGGMEPAREVRASSFYAKPQESSVYTLRAIDLNGCTYNRQVTVEVTDSISLELSADRLSVCEGDLVNLYAEGASVVNWSPSEVLSSSTGNEIEAFPTETTTFLVSATNEAGCHTRKRITIEVDPIRPVILEAQDLILCPGQTTLLTASGGDYFDWSPALGLSQNYGAMVSATPATTTTYTVSRREGGCGASAHLTLEVQKPDPLLISPVTAVICEGDQVSLRVSGGKRYVWEMTDGLATVAGNQVQVAPSVSTQYVVRSLDEKGCELVGTASVVVVHPDFLEASASARTVCAGEEVTIRAKGAESYYWTGDLTLSDSTGARVYASPTIGTEYTVVGIDPHGCEDTLIIPVEVREFEATFQLSPSTIDLADAPAIVQFEGELEGAVEYEWNFGEKGRSSEPNPMHIFSHPGRYEIQLAATDGICVSRTSQSLIVDNSSSLEEIRDEGLIQLQATGDGVYTLSFVSPRAMYLGVRIMDQHGTELLSGTLRPEAGPFQQRFDLSGYSPGAYFLRVSDGEVSQTFSMIR